MRKFRVVIILLLLCSCTTNNEKSISQITAEKNTTSPEPTKKNIPTQKTTISSAILPIDLEAEETELARLKSEAELIFTFQESVSEDFPLFTFDVKSRDLTAKEKNAEFPAWEYIVEISCPELPDYIPQSIEISAYTSEWKEEYRESYLNLVDIDFNGYADFEYVSATGTGGIGTDYYRWNPSAEGCGKFEKDSSFNFMMKGYTLYPDTKQIGLTFRKSSGNYSRSIYQLTTVPDGNPLGEYKKIRYQLTDEEVDEENNLVFHVFFEDEKLYTWKHRNNEPDETPPDIYAEEEKMYNIANNYLRFGVPDPINLETAQNLLHDEFGKSDSETGFELSFVFEEMILHQKLSCYKFRMSHFVNNDHWDTHDFVAVSPLGEIIYSENFDYTIFEN